MFNSAEQIHQGKLNTQPVRDDSVKLFIDLDICAKGACRHCEARCSYFYHPGNYGIISCAELANYALVCRRCEEPHCVNACPHDALEQQKDKNKLLVRHSIRCVTCRSCSHACPYGTIYPELVPQLVHVCDFCLGRRDKPGEQLCVSACPYGALSIKKANEVQDQDTFLLGDNLIVHSTHWQWEKA